MTKNVSELELYAHDPLFREQADLLGLPEITDGIAYAEQVAFLASQSDVAVEDALNYVGTIIGTSDGRVGNAVLELLDMADQNIELVPEPLRTDYQKIATRLTDVVFAALQHSIADGPHDFAA